MAGLLLLPGGFRRGILDLELWGGEAALAAPAPPDPLLRALAGGGGGPPGDLNPAPSELTAKGGGLVLARGRGGGEVELSWSRSDLSPSSLPSSDRPLLPGFSGFDPELTLVDLRGGRGGVAGAVGLPGASEAELARGGRGALRRCLDCKRSAPSPPLSQSSSWVAWVARGLGAGLHLGAPGPESLSKAPGIFDFGKAGEAPLYRGMLDPTSGSTDLGEAGGPPDLIGGKSIMVSPLSLLADGDREERGEDDCASEGGLDTTGGDNLGGSPPLSLVGEHGVLWCSGGEAAGGMVRVGPLALAVSTGWGRTNKTDTFIVINMERTFHLADQQLSGNLTSSLSQNHF